MTDLRLTIRALLWERQDDLGYIRSLLDACERAELLGTDELAHWRTIAEGQKPPPPAADLRAAERHLEALLAAVSPMTRELDPAATAAKRRFSAAVDALHGSGVLGDDAARDWRSRALAATAPWLDDDDLAQISSGGGWYAISVPPSTPEEEVGDAARTREFEVLARRGTARRVFVPQRVRRRDGRAIVAVVTRTEATEVLFHHVGEPQGDVTHGSAAMAAFRETVDRLVPPALSDDAGTVYAPAGERPVSSHGAGGTPDLARPRVITGVWRYQPPAPESATAFEVRTPGGRFAV